MRRLSLPVGVALAMLSLAPIATVTSSADAASGPVRAERSAARAAPVAPTAPVAPALPAGIPDEIDLLTAVPALQSALGDRYGGYWIDARAGREVMHVAVVGATGADRATVARLTGGHPAVRTESVRHGYDDLLAAQEEIAVSMQGRGTDFTVDVDVATNRVVVSTESADARTTAATAQGAARRGVERRTVQRAPARTGAAGARPAPPGDRMPAADVGAAVAIEPNARIEVAPSTRDRWTYPPYEAGLAVTTAVGSTRYLCTSGFLFRSSAIGYFASTAGHCGPIGSPTWIGRLRADSIRHNGYYSSRQVTADASLIYRGAAWVPWPVIHSVTHPSVAGQFSNAQLANGLSLCFEGDDERQPELRRGRAGQPVAVLRRDRPFLPLHVHQLPERPRRQRRRRSTACSRATAPRPRAWCRRR